MYLAIFLSFKESMEIMKYVGQHDRFINYYLKPYSQSFEKIFIFSWTKEKFDFPLENVVLVPNRFNINVYLYNFFLPIIEKKILKLCPVIRLMQFTSIIPAIISKKLFGTKVIATYGFPYSKSLQIKGARLKYILWNFVEKITFKNVNKFIVTYQDNKDFLLKNGVQKDKIILLPNGVDTTIFHPTIKKSDTLDKNKIKLIYIGRLEKEKNVINLIKAIKTSKYANKIHLTLIGQGSLKKEIEKLLNNFGVRHRMISSVPHNGIVEHLQNSNIFLLTSLTEGYPKVLIEAMACGLPCMVSRYQGYKSIVKERENAITCGFEPNEIARSIDELIENDDLRQKISAGARLFVEQNNDIKKIIDREIGYIQSLAT